MRVRRAWSNAVGRLLPGLGAAALVTISVATASAQVGAFPECTKEPTAQDVEGAKGAHRAAAQWFEKADYDRAIQYWRDAYSLDCTKHALLLNIASAYEKKGDKQAAIDTLQIYLMRAPNAADAATISEKVINLKNSMKPAAPPAGTTVAPPVPTGPATAEPPPPPPPDTGGKTNYAPWIVVGVGGVATIVGAILLPVGLGNISSAEELCGGSRQCTDEAAIDKGNSGRTMATIGTPLLIGGLLMVAGGLVWQFVFNKPAATAVLPGKPQGSTGFVTVAPALGPGAGSLSLSGAF